MTNGSGASNAPPAVHPAGPSGNLMPRRSSSSYASVLSGAVQQSNALPARAGAFSHLINSAASSSYPPQSVPDSRYHRQPSGHDPDPNPNADRLTPWGRDSQLPSYSRKFVGMIDSTMPSYGAAGSFFVPSYLWNSRYMAKLEAAHKAKLAAQREASSVAKPASLSTSSSNANLHRMAPSHRGMTYDIIENAPPSGDDKLAPLPSRWSDTDKDSNLDLLQDGMEVRYNGPHHRNEHEAATARADQPMPPACGVYYFEVEIKNKSKDGMIAVGFSSRLASLGRLPGWQRETWAYHGDDGKSFFDEGTSKTYGPTFGTNDVVGCGVNFASGSAFFTINGRNLGVAFKELKNIQVFPAVGLKKSPLSCVRVNFGQKPFVFDIDSLVAEQRGVLDREIDATPVSVLRLEPPLDESTLVRELVAHFLAHDGYVETAKAFAQDIRAQSRPLQDPEKTGALQDPIVEEDYDAVHRQKIRAAILDGDIDKAMKHTTAYYPHVLEDNPEILFRLKCRKYVEMILRCSELSNPASSPNLAMPAFHSKSVNNSHTDVFAGDMDIDDDDGDDESDDDGSQFHPTNSGNGNGEGLVDDEEGDEEEKEEDEEEEYHSVPADPMKYDDLLQEVLSYGRTLMLEYRDEKREYRRTLEDIFSLIAYDDAKSSVHGHLLETGERVQVAEEVNAAILVSLGRSPSAGLERLYQQTEALLSDLSDIGGPAALVNVRDVFSP